MMLVHRPISVAVDVLRGATNNDNECSYEEEPSSTAGSPATAQGASAISSAAPPNGAWMEEDEEAMLAEMERMKRATLEACMVEVETHLDRFLKSNPWTGTYEQWIGELHPENLRVNPHSGEMVIDHRFYVEGSDHRRLWNSTVDERRKVPPQSYGGGSPTVAMAQAQRRAGAFAPVSPDLQSALRSALVAGPLVAPAPLTWLPPQRQLPLLDPRAAVHAAPAYMPSHSCGQGRAAPQYFGVAAAYSGPQVVCGVAAPAPCHLQWPPRLEGVRTLRAASLRMPPQQEGYGRAVPEGVSSMIEFRRFHSYEPPVVNPPACSSYASIAPSGYPQQWPRPEGAPTLRAPSPLYVRPQQDVYIPQHVPVAGGAGGHEFKRANSYMPPAAPAQQRATSCGSSYRLPSPHLGSLDRTVRSVAYAAPQMLAAREVHLRAPAYAQPRVLIQPWEIVP